MAVTPGSTSGTYDFSLTGGQVVTEAFDRIQIRPAELTRHHMISARTSMNLEILQWSNAGFNLWKIVSGTIDLVTNQEAYTLQADLVTLTDVWYSTVNGNGAGYNQDRILTPITRQEYANIPNKLQPGTPNQFWYQMLPTPTITFWQPPSIGAPGYVVNWYGLQRIQDANLGGGEAPDVVPRALDALCARLAWRLARKFAPALTKDLKAEADEAWDDFATRDQEMGPTTIQPNVSGYARIT